MKKNYNVSIDDNGAGFLIECFYLSGETKNRYAFGEEDLKSCLSFLKLNKDILTIAVYKEVEVIVL